MSIAFRSRSCREAIACCTRFTGREKSYFGDTCRNHPGLAVNNMLTLPKSIRPGTSFATTTTLRAGIVCVGAKLSMLELFSAGLVGIPVVLVCVGTGLGFVRWFGNYLGLPPRMSSLIAAGTSICGVTAITAVAPAIKAKPQEVSYAVANVVYLGHWV